MRILIQALCSALIGALVTLVITGSASAGVLVGVGAALTWTPAAGSFEGLLIPGSCGG